LINLIIPYHSFMYWLMIKYNYIWFRVSEILIYPKI
jgi:hypothetical protein